MHPIQNAAARLVFSLLRFTLTSLHCCALFAGNLWLPEHSCSTTNPRTDRPHPNLWERPRVNLHLEPFGASELLELSDELQDPLMEAIRSSESSSRGIKPGYRHPSWSGRESRSQSDRDAAPSRGTLPSLGGIGETQRCPKLRGIQALQPSVQPHPPLRVTTGRFRFSLNIGCGYGASRQLK